MSAASDPSLLGWHADWLVDHAQERAAATFIEMIGAPASFDENGLLLWERRGLELAGVVRFGMDSLETPEFTEHAQLVAIEIFLRRLHQLLAMAPEGGCA